MHPDLEKMVALQNFDLEAKRLREEIAALPARIAGFEKKAQAAVQQLAKVKEAQAKEEQLRRRQESDIQDHRTKVARVQRQMDQATTTVQLAAFEHEIAFGGAEIARLEEAELESMERSEGLAADQVTAEQTLEEAEITLKRERERGSENIERDKLSLGEVEKRRKALRPEIGEAALATYDRISKSKGTAVAEAINQKCMACQMMLRPQRWNDLRDRSNQEEMMACESCGRLLYYDPARDAPQRKPVPEESIAASIVRSL